MLFPLLTLLLHINFSAHIFLFFFDCDWILTRWLIELQLTFWLCCHQIEFITYMRARESQINISGVSMLSDESTRKKNGPASYAHTHAHTHTHTNVHIHIHTCIYKYIHPHMRTHTLTLIHARMHTRMHAHTPHTHVHASTLYAYSF